MDTMPMPLESLAAAGSRLEDFRITTPAEISAMLKRLMDGNVHLGVNAPNGTSITATLWTVDSAKGAISFSVVANEPNLDGIVECDEAVVVGYLDSVKLQFDVNNLVLVRGLNSVAIKGNFPREMFRFQRRNGFRVRPMVRTTPVATLRHPMIPDMQLKLRVLDVSIGGCALFLPNDVPALDAGVLMNGGIIDLDAHTRIKTGLRLPHLTSLNPESGGGPPGWEQGTPAAASLPS